MAKQTTKKAPAKATKKAARPVASAGMRFSDRLVTAVKHLVIGKPLEERRKGLAKRSKKDKIAMPKWARITAGGAFALLLAWTALAVGQIITDPGHPMSWTMAWLFGIPALGLGGYLFGWLPSSGKSRGLFAAMYALGLLGVPFLAVLATNFSVAVLMVSAFLVLPWLIAMQHYAQNISLYQEGYAV